MGNILISYIMLCPLLIDLKTFSSDLFCLPVLFVCLFVCLCFVVIILFVIVSCFVCLLVGVIGVFGCLI